MHHFKSLTLWISCTDIMDKELQDAIRRLKANDPTLTKLQ